MAYLIEVIGCWLYVIVYLLLMRWIYLGVGLKMRLRSFFCSGYEDKQYMACTHTLHTYSYMHTHTHTHTHRGTHTYTHTHTHTHTHTYSTVTRPTSVNTNPPSLFYSHCLWVVHKTLGKSACMRPSIHPVLEAWCKQERIKFLHAVIIVQTWAHSY